MFCVCCVYDNLLCVRRRKFIFTTDSRHGLPIYPNLAEGLAVTGIDQLWVADITYIRLQREFVYLAVLLDAFSRRVWAGHCGGAWKRLWRWKPCAWRCGNAGRSRDWCITPIAACNTLPATTPQQLQQHGIRISMSRTASPYDNAQAESFMKTLKYEEVYRTEYRDLEDARASIGEFLEKIYNRERLHSALGYRPPLEFERHLRRAAAMGRERA